MDSLPPRAAFGRSRSAGRSPAVALNRVTLDAPSVLLVAGAERDLGTIDLAVPDRGAQTAGSQRAGHLLIPLFEDQLTVSQLPGALRLGRHIPEIGAAIDGAFPLQPSGLIGSPLAHVESVRYDPG